MKYELYQVGGHIRDRLLGLDSKDIDYSVIIPDTTLEPKVALDMFVKQIKSEGYDVFLVTPECLTVRAKFPTDHIHSGVADFVLARKELYYIKNSREPVVKLGTLEDDLKRRDFTVNALAEKSDGTIIDLFNGAEHLKYKMLVTPGDPIVSFKDDPLRILRALRFCVTKGFLLSQNIKLAICEMNIKDLKVVSHERIREEINKALRFNTIRTLQYLELFERDLSYNLTEYMFKNTGLYLEATNKKK